MTSASSSTVTLPTHVDVRVVGELHQQCLERLSGPAVSIDGSQVERCDAAGAQLLLAVARRSGSAPVNWALSSALEEQLASQGIDLSVFSPRVAP